MLSTLNVGEVSKNCLVFDIVKFLKKGLTELFFLMLSSSQAEKVSQNSFVFKLAAGQIDR